MDEVIKKRFEEDWEDFKLQLAKYIDKQTLANVIDDVEEDLEKLGFNIN